MLRDLAKFELPRLIHGKKRKARQVPKNATIDEMIRQLFFASLRICMLNYTFLRKRRDSLTIFMFHRVNDGAYDFYPAMSVKAFTALCKYIKKHYEVIKISDVHGIRFGSGKPAAVISFDDGHYDILENAHPLLAELSLPYNINIDTEVLETGKPQCFVRVYDILNNTTLEHFYNGDYMDQSIVIDRGNPMDTENAFTALLGEMPHDAKNDLIKSLQKEAEVDDTVYSRMLSKEDIAYLANSGVEIGSHTHTHPLLPSLTNGELEFELAHSKGILEKITGSEVSILAYPNGKHDKRVEEMARSLGYSVFLLAEDKINDLRSNSEGRFFRINQYHQSLNEALAHTYGISRMLQSLRN